MALTEQKRIETFSAEAQDPNDLVNNIGVDKAELDNINNQEAISLILNFLNSLKHFHEGTFRHSLRMAPKCLKLAEHFFPGNDQIKQELAIAALLHDCGKEEVGLKIVDKPGPLDQVEEGRMQEHPRIIFEKIKKYLPRIAQLILLHHPDERTSGDRRERSRNEKDRRQEDIAPEIERLAEMLRMVDIADVLLHGPQERKYMQQEGKIWNIQETKKELQGEFPHDSSRIVMKDYPSRKQAIDYLIKIEEGAV